MNATGIKGKAMMYECMHALLPNAHDLPMYASICLLHLHTYGRSSRVSGNTTQPEVMPLQLK